MDRFACNLLAVEPAVEEPDAGRGAGAPGRCRVDIVAMPSE
jgi:hypothetical protein